MKNDDRLLPAVQLAAKLSLPPSLAAELEATMTNKTIPEKSILSRNRFLGDALLAVYQRRYFGDLASHFDAMRPPCLLTLIVDSSTEPRLGEENSIVTPITPGLNLDLGKITS